jgi:mannitol/fructose-specific phosphotransferase system IIA component (Ntr-type)
MAISKLLKDECIVINSTSKSKEEIILEIASVAKKSTLLSNYKEKDISDKLTSREAISSTGMEKGIAIPHCSFPQMDDFIIGIIRTEIPIDYNALDGVKSQLFIFIIGPEKQRNRYIKILSSIAQAIRIESNINLLMNSSDTQTIKDLFNSKLEIEKIEKTKNNEKALITIVVQNEDYFDELLQASADEIGGSIVVYEGENASRYLHKLPLFAAFWNGPQNSFCTVITNLVDKVAINTVIRKVKSIVPNIEKEEGVLLTVQDISYSLGSLDF